MEQAQVCEFQCIKEKIKEVSEIECTEYYDENDDDDDEYVYLMMVMTPHSSLYKKLCRISSLPKHCHLH